MNNPVAKAGELSAFGTDCIQNVPSCVFCVCVTHLSQSLSKQSDQHHTVHIIISIKTASQSNTSEHSPRTFIPINDELFPVLQQSKYRWRGPGKPQQPKT
jgi:hypothetical protein